MQSTEQWRPVSGFEGAYEVSDRGRVRSLDRFVSAGGSPYRVLGQAIRSSLNPNGYEVVTLKLRGRKSSRYVHRLVAEAFITGREDGFEVLHSDGDKRNNSAMNLSWGSRSANINDQVRHGSHANAAKTHCPKGHEYTRENIYAPAAHPDWRECRACIRVRVARRAAVRASREPMSS